ncbi:hypothetical protein FOCC_FOCC004489 [Frankliniella occidentalis]|uniref:xylose isomerase n=1 Tax=Frankliniella occidentalis TaxID=133901 RepID=A0A6J1RYT5_FRAOC|nr:xylose isomerase-like [Frankliniella occidentalis]KAE8748686.1 hypothetical protein FOCC_FOCC004489 [Frankliniella occidentalis]
MSKLSSQQQQLAAAVAAKRQRVATSAPSSAKADVSEYFSGVPRIEYRPDAGPEEALCYRYYNPGERCHGRTMEEWLRPALSFGHALRSAGSEAYGQPPGVQQRPQRPWDDGTNSLDNYHRRIRAAFELCNKLGIRLWAAWDRDLAPEGDSLEETQRNLDESVDLCLELQQQQQQQQRAHGAAAGPIKPLWLGADLHSHPRYCQGAGTAPDAGVLAVAGTQVRRALQAAQRLSAECFLFWGGRDGYASPLNTDPARELRGYARLLRMTAEHRDRLGYRGQLLLETTHLPCGAQGQAARPSVRRYDDCAASAVGLLRQFGLDRHFKLSTPPGHQVVVSSAYGMLGCLNATAHDFPPDVREATVVMKSVLEQGGVQPGGLLIGVPMRREALDARDLVGAYVAVIDCYAKALRAAVKLVADGAFSRNLQQRYLSFHSGFGARLSSGEATLEDCEEHARKLQQQQQQLQQQQQQQQPGEGQLDWCLVSGRPEHWEAVCGRYIDAVADSSRE